MGDFCRQVVAKYKKNRVTSFAPEYVFARLVLILAEMKYRHYGRKVSIDLLMLMNAPYRPWFICDKDPEAIKLLNGVGINFDSSVYDAFPKYVVGAIQHPYLALVLKQHTNHGTGIKSFYDLDAYTLVNNIREMINKKGFYRTCVEFGYFKRDEVLLQLFEFLVEALDGHRLSKYGTAVELFAKDLHYALGRKSQLLILKCYSVGARSQCFRSSICEFKHSKNYSTKNDYKVPFYRLVANVAIQDGDWSLFESSFELLKTILGEVDPIVKALERDAGAKRAKTEEALLPKPNYRTEIEQGLLLERAVADVSFMREVEYYRSYHLFSPTYIEKARFDEITTQNLINLIVLLGALNNHKVKSLVLHRQAILSMYPDDSITWEALADLIAAKIIKLDLNAFEDIPIKSLNNIESYFGMRFKINLEGVHLGDPLSLQNINAVIKGREDQHASLLVVWRKYVESHFYEALREFSAKHESEFDQKFNVGTRFKINLRKNKLSASILRLVVYQSIARSAQKVSSSSAAKVFRAKNVFSLNLTRYLNEAEQGGFNDLPTIPKNPKKPMVEQVLTLLTGLDESELYTLRPRSNYLPKILHGFYVKEI